MRTSITRRAALFLTACTASFALVATASAQTSIKIGYAISKTGPNAGGAAITTMPNYELWVKEVNAAGGIKLGDKRVPIEVVEYDDRSNAEEAVQRARTPDQPGQGRFHPAALGHRPQSRGRPDAATRTAIRTSPRRR